MPERPGSPWDGPPRHDERTARTARTAELVDELHRVVGELERLHPGRKFPLDGHLVGSLGEAAAEALFDLQLVAASTAGHDAVAVDGRKVEIKATYGSSGIAIRPSSEVADVLVVLRLSRTAGKSHEVCFNGPVAIALEAAGAVGSNGQARIGLGRLRSLDRLVKPSDRVPARRRPG